MEGRYKKKGRKEIYSFSEENSQEIVDKSFSALIYFKKIN